MATSPFPENQKNQTVANLDAWKKAGATIEPSTNGGLRIVTSQKLEDTPAEGIGSISFSAKDAFKSSLEVNEEFSQGELNTIVDNTILHIKELAENGEMDAHIDISKFNDGMSRELVKELKRRGFSVRRSRAYGLTVSWEQRINWWLIGGILLTALILGSLLTAAHFVMKEKVTKPVQVESPR